ncbi:MAG: polysaccharide biosynthesis C-terminal domain-containing protein [Rhodothermus sp.]|nr:polysaccharide biosynthesis C-terminal domain-containing protein [Rhodothermus sp.]
MSQHVLARLLRQGSIYALGNLLLKASGLLLAPLYLNTVLLPQAAYGYLVLLEATAQLLLPLLGLGMTTGLLRFATDVMQQDRREAVPFTVLGIMLGGALLVGIGSWIGAPWLNQQLDWPDGVLILRLFGCYLAAKMLSSVPLAFLRLRERAALYTAAILLEAALLIGGVYYFLAHAHLGLRGVVQAMAVASGSSALVLVGAMLRTIPRRWDYHLVGQLIRFGMPLALAGVALPILHVGDRYLLDWLTGSETVAIYGWAARLSGVLNMLLVQSFQLAFAVIGLKTLGEQPEGEAVLHRRTFRHYATWGGWMALVLSLGAYDITALLASDSVYLKADPLVLPLSLGYLLFGLYNIFVNVLYAAGESRFIAWNVVGAGLLNIGLNLWWIPQMGAMGAALATVVAYGVLAGGAAWRALHVRPTTYPWRVLAIVVALTVGLGLVGYETATWPIAARLAGRVLLVLLYGLLIVVFRVYRYDELREGWQWLRQRLQTIRSITE